MKRPRPAPDATDSTTGGRRRRDRGAVFLEFALLVPILTVLAMGIVEYGLGWKWANDVNAAVRDSARTGTSQPAYLTADRSILLTVGTLLTEEQIDNLEKVIVYSSTDPDGKPSDSCKARTNTTGSSTSPGSKRGQSGCNAYGKGQIRYVLNNPTDDGPWVNSDGDGCDSNDLDANWCPATRDRNLTTGDFDYIGVYIVVKKPSTTNFGFGQMTIERNAVFQLEPAFGGN